MENLLNYTSDVSSEYESDQDTLINTELKNKDESFISNLTQLQLDKKKESNTNNLNLNLNSNSNSNSNTKNLIPNLKIQPKTPKNSVVLYKEIKNSNNNAKNTSNFKRNDRMFIQHQLMKLPAPIYQTTSYSDLHLENSVYEEEEEEERVKQIQRNVQYSLQKENKRKLEALYQSYRTSAQLNSRLDQPVRPYVSKRQKKPVEQRLVNGKLINDKSMDHEKQQQQLLYINSSYLHKPSDDYFQSKKFTQSIPSYTVGQLYGHTKGVNVLRWKPDDGYLLASASMDGTACIWDVFHSKKPARIIQHEGAVKDVQWRKDATHVLTASFDKTIQLFDVEAGKMVQTFNNQDMVNVLRFHPKDQDLFIAGLYKKGIVCWDVRSNKIVSEYKGFFGQVQDLEFLEEGKTFLAASDIIKRNSTDKAIVVWDFSGCVILSNQIYQEAYNCTALRVHPNKKKFIAQSNAGYIAIFDTKNPWTLDKFKRFESHQVSGNRIQCNFSPNGKYVGSGSSDGKLYFYDWKSSKCVKTLDYGVHSGATCMDVAWCPQPQKYGYACVASADTKGRIALWN
ncbi:WD40 repeat-like protein [Neocallimastix lanati (nom. inval.)]|jgi:WD40 repeat protein|nr:WD40 repeat-like protein [Neocallimastix sp. JGI-2020a]